MKTLWLGTGFLCSCRKDHNGGLCRNERKSEALVEGSALHKLRLFVQERFSRADFPFIYLTDGIAVPKWRRL